MMGPTERYVVEWSTGGFELCLIEPTIEEVRLHAAALAQDYNEPRNRALMTNEHDFTGKDVVDQFASMQAEGGRPFLLFDEHDLVGDCDLRHIDGASAELAIMVGPRAAQGKGLGTRFSIMLMALAFDRLGLTTIYASVRPENTGSLRMFDKLGYRVDTSPEARRFAEAEDDVCLSMDAQTFSAKHTERLVREPLVIRTR
jgi:RimJ/RimL family protein N-acetyltransferase